MEVIVYADFGCPYCASAWARIRELPLSKTNSPPLKALSAAYQPTSPRRNDT